MLNFLLAHYETVRVITGIVGGMMIGGSLMRIKTRNACTAILKDIGLAGNNNVAHIMTSAITRINRNV